MVRKYNFENEKEPKYSTRKVKRCIYCGRARGKVRPYICRMHFSERIKKGLAPGWKKVS